MEDAKPARPQESFSTRQRRRFQAIARASLEYLSSITRDIRLPLADAVLVEGKDLRSGRSVVIFYFGIYLNFHWVLDAIVSERVIKEIHKDVPSKDVLKYVEKYESASDLVFLDLGYLHSKFLEMLKINYLCIPDWIGQKMDICDSRQELLRVLRRNRKQDIANIEKQNLTYQIVSGENYYEDFYRNYYLPFAKKKFGEKAVVEPEHVFLRQCRNGKVMQLLRKDEVLAYSLLELESGTLRDVHLGISGTIDKESYRIVFSALYYYSILYGFDNGCDVVDFTFSRPLLNGGVYKYKKIWGGYVYNYPGIIKNFFIKPTRFSEPVIGILSSNFFLMRRKDKLAAKMLCADGELSIQYIENAMKNYYSKGIDSLGIYSLTPVDPAVVAWSRRNAPPVEIVDLSGERHPQEVFCM